MTRHASTPGARANGAAQEKAVTGRRSFLASSAAGAGAFVAGVVANGKVNAALAEIPSISIPKEFSDSRNQAPKPGTFEGQGMTGAEVFARLCKEEELAAMFCCPGNYTVINAIAAAGIPSYGGRTEGSMCAAADGFSRATGEVTACSGTEGPGFTHMIMNIAAAAAARTPLLVLASNTTIAADDREGFVQTIDQQPTTTGIKKYGKRLIAPDRVWEYGSYAFRNLKSGVPGPVHLDFPGEVARARFTDPAKLKDFYSKDKYRTESRACPCEKDVQKAVELINKSERPLVIAGQGVFQDKATDALLTAAEKNELAVVTSGPFRGHFPDEHRLSANLTPDALMSADLVIFVGQYCMPTPGEYRLNADVKSIRVHPVHEDIGRNWPIDLGIVSSERAFLEALAEALPGRKRDSWVNELDTARKTYSKKIHDEYERGLKHSRATDHLHPAVIGKEVHDFLYKGDIDPKQTVTGWGGWTIGTYVGRWLRAHRPAQGITCGYQFGAIGPDLAMMIGAGAAVQQGVGPQSPYKGAPVLCVTSDASTAYSLFELETAQKYQIPVVTVVYNNNCWGTWPQASNSARSMHMYYFHENLRYDQIAQALGGHGEYVRTPEEFREALARCYQLASREKVSSVINCQALKEFTSAREYPPGLYINPEPGCGAFAH
jgi:thiamine pyrophosphate-dependent acetolactate synthase large subunit-like protein